MNKTLIRLALAGILPALLSCGANADNSGNATLVAVKKAFEQRFADRQVLAVRATPLKGIYEVDVQGNQIVYVDQKLSYLFVGDLIDVKSGQSLTEARQAELNHVAWDSLPFADAFKEVRGNGARKLAVFTDPDCPYCKQLEQEGLKGVDNVTIYTFLFPLTQLHPDAMHKAKQIWCSADRLKTWRTWMDTGVKPAGSDACDTPIERNLALGEKLGVTGTPALVFGNGRLVAGALGKAQLEQLLDAK
ncbi:DsbC family protein [Paludibacterium purpuratum]|uniref:Thiol:disulfide interchange protein n=1 Tax=Paludibacterium purpuratum TaxID=1144873 RepID=A0A4R7BD89_9NEIS|nr:DsbC family protein [Paludibacterium purpuratum]TDR82948.1 thiol:disulfide interchange protein DsbC [Paludibacterium purpuratum]